MASLRAFPLLILLTRQARAVQLARAAARSPWMSAVPRASSSPPLRMLCAPAGGGEAELSKSQQKKMLKAAARAELKAQKAADKQAQPALDTAAASSPAAEEAPAPFRFSAPPVCRSEANDLRLRRSYVSLRELGTPAGPALGEEVWVRGRLYRLRGKGRQCFIVLRERGYYTVQACFFHDKAFPTQSKAMLNFLQGLTEESIVDVRGTLQAAEVKACSQKTVELQLIEVVLVSAAEPMLPFEIDDAARSEEELLASEATERPLARIGQELRLNHRWVDLRVPAQHAVMRTQERRAAVCALFRESLVAQGFVEIHTPKLIAGESEGGAGVFRTDYFGTPACLAQSPQLYKQMAISADFDRVFEIGPVFRAENSNTRRHLCEFTGLDLEMSFKLHYNEVIEVVHQMFVHMFDGLETTYAADLAAVRAQFPSSPPRWGASPCVVHWEEGMELLHSAGIDAPPREDLSTAHERALGALVAERYATDLYFLDRFPSAARPFYTMPCADDASLSNSYDVFLRGEEICSGAQRIHEPSLLQAAIAAKGLPAAPLQPYVDAMRHGMPPHGGGGIGLERLVFLYLDLDNVRRASMFPRDPNRCSP
ncbi:hypothetical protein AB1Y20_022768 [Prymnesium parvum]|uniref:aspartate--tRNA ligase n=1 Tax=Prymnesium parvum TaxID=97485 RepID=A0AB34JH65_PRYPA